MIPRVQFPKARTERTVLLLGLFCFLLTGVLGVKEILAPAPTATLKRDFSVCTGWIEEHAKMHHRLPEVEEFQRFAFGQRLVVKVAYDVCSDRQRYRLTGWDGEHRWVYESEESSLSLLK